MGAAAEHELLLPPAVATLVLNQRDRPDLRSTIARTQRDEARWLFPGLRPGRPMDATSLAAKLKEHGIWAPAARNTASCLRAAPGGRPAPSGARSPRAR